MIGVFKRLLSVRPAVDDHLLTVLGETRLFENLSLADIEELAERIETRTYSDGASIFRIGDPGDGLYIIDRGGVEVFLEIEQGEHRLALLHDREYFGEMALIDEAGRRTASARARGETICLFLSRDDFENLLASSHVTAARILYQLCRVLSRRLGRTSRQLAGKAAEEESRSPRVADSAPAFLPPPPPR
jgi:CRP-like cAMP-binding protein